MGGSRYCLTNALYSDENIVLFIQSTTFLLAFDCCVGVFASFVSTVTPRSLSLVTLLM